MHVHDHGADLPGAEHGGDLVDAFAQMYDDPVAGPDAAREQPVGNPAGLGRKLGVGHAPRTVYGRDLAGARPALAASCAPAGPGFANDPALAMRPRWRFLG